MPQTCYYLLTSLQGGKGDGAPPERTELRFQLCFHTAGDSVRSTPGRKSMLCTTGFWGLICQDICVPLIPSLGYPCRTAAGPDFLQDACAHGADTLGSVQPCCLTFLPVFRILYPVCPPHLPSLSFLSLPLYCAPDPLPFPTTCRGSAAPLHSLSSLNQPLTSLSFNPALSLSSTGMSLQLHFR